MNDAVIGRHRFNRQVLCCKKESCKASLHSDQDSVPGVAVYDTVKWCGRTLSHHKTSYMNVKYDSSHIVLLIIPYPRPGLFVMNGA
jgi:hypothetical protein